MYIRKACAEDASRIAEILVFNNRINFFPIFKDEYYSFNIMQVSKVAASLLASPEYDSTWVYDDGVLRGVLVMAGEQIEKLYVDPMFQSRGIGAKLLAHACENCGAKWLWALEKNERAIEFYKRNGFVQTEEKILEEDTTEYLVKMRYM